MSSSPILQGKCAVVFGAGGSIGAAVAKEFAAEGAEVFLAGRTKSSVEDAEDAGGFCYTYGSVDASLGGSAARGPLG
jgi:NAD(P)-dependent dehydrogenase (short-subunit alcohol dehydrogenase family)